MIMQMKLAVMLAANKLGVFSSMFNVQYIKAFIEQTSNVI